MVLFFTTTLIISIAGMSALMMLKQIEISTGVIILARIRPQVNRFFHAILLVIERSLPALVREAIVAVLKRLRGALQKMLAHGILWFETTLQNLLHLLREKTHPQHHRGEASAFLKEVGEYKKQIETTAKESEIEEMSK
mgnify:CR=1 FL=1